MPSPIVFLQILEQSIHPTPTACSPFFKDYLKKDYREIIDLVVEMDRIRSLLAIITIPHFTTLQIFF
jgi:hypothetical protein